MAVWRRASTLAPDEQQPINWLTVAKIAGAFMAFLIGSGFATGQEAMQFFAVYGFRGVLGALISVILFFYSCVTLMKAGKRFGLKRNEDVFRHFCGPYIGVFLTWYTMIFIVAVHAIMLAGAGATLHQAYGLPPLVGSGLMALLSMATLLMGLNKILDVMGLVGPLIVVLTIGIAGMSLLENAPGLASGANQVVELDILKASPHWLFSALLYVGLTLPGLASFLPAVGATAGSEREITAASVLGPLLYIAAMIAVILALLASIGEVYQAQIPIMSLASGVLPAYGSFFAVVIFLGIYTTVTPLLWTVCSRFAQECTRRYQVLVVGLTAVGLLGGAFLPFGRLVNLIYPTVGYAGLLFLSCVLFTDLKSAWFAAKGGNA
jgi:uncharacterized membrane protein YkvI